MATLLPLAHTGHWLPWVLYVPPILIAIASLLRSKLLETRAGRAEETPAERAEGES